MSRRKIGSYRRMGAGKTFVQGTDVIAEYVGTFSGGAIQPDWSIIFGCKVIGFGGTVTLKFTYSETDAGPAWIKPYVNGIDMGKVQDSVAGVKSWDIPVSDGDTVEVWGKCANTANSCHCANIRLCGFLTGHAATFYGL